MLFRALYVNVFNNYVKVDVDGSQGHYRPNYMYLFTI